MKVLLYGKNGWIGEQVYNILVKGNHEVVVGNERAEDFVKLEEEIVKIKPTNIISTIGRTHGKIGDLEYTTIDYLEQKGKIRENVRDNLFSPMMIALLANKHNIPTTTIVPGFIINPLNASIFVFIDSSLI